MTVFRPAIAAAPLAMSVLALSVLLLPGLRQPAWSEAAAPAPAKADGGTCNRGAFRVVVDVGHTAEVPGAISARGIYEYEFNLRLAQQVEKRLLEAGFDKTTLLITSGKAHRTLFERAARANKMAADLFLAIHHDSVPDRFLEKWQYEDTERGYSDRFKGHSLFISKSNGDYKASLLFGHLLGMQLKARGLQYTPHYVEKFMGSRRRVLVDTEAGVYRYDQLIVLRATHMPAVLLEAGSIINRDEEVELSSPERQALTTAAVVDAVEAFCAARTARPRPTAAAQPTKRAGRH